MFKKVLVLGICAAVAAAGMSYSPPAQADTGWYFVSVCNTPSECSWTIWGGAPVWFGPYSTLEQCVAQHDLWQDTLFGQQPRGLSTCFPQ